MTTPYFEDESVTVYVGDCLDVMRALPDASVDSVCTDPPYSLSFLGREWDTHNSPAEFQQWCNAWAKECLRVLKPGGYLLAFGAPRTWHRLAAGIEDAGLEIRDSIAWLNGNGYPKSQDVAKSIDKRRDDREAILRVTGWLRYWRVRRGVTNRQIDDLFGFNGMSSHWMALPSNSVAELPSWEQWVRLKEFLNFGDEMDLEVWRLHGRKGTPGDAWQTAEVVKVERRHNMPNGIVSVGQGARVLIDRQIKASNSEEARRWEGWGTALKPGYEPVVVARKPLPNKVRVAENVLKHGTGALNIAASRTNAGRWPTNVVLDDVAAADLDGQTGTLTSGKMRAGTPRANRDGWAGAMPEFTGAETYGDSGGASRFFPVFKYTPKAGSNERPEVDGIRHPTIKPLDLVRWMVRLVNPPGGTVLDPFAGSGTTAEACLLEHFKCIAIEREPDYLPLIVQRLSKPMEIGFDFGEVS